MTFPAYVRDTGSGQPVIFLHAFPLNADMWNPQHAGLPSRVLSFDLPGFGRGGPVESGATMQSYAQGIFNLMDKLGIESAVLGGCSMGGYIVMEALRQQPARIKGIILANTKATADSPEARENRYNQAEKVAKDGTSELTATMAGKLISSHTQHQNPRAVQELRSMLDAATPEGIIAGLKAMAKRPDSMATLSSITIPACIITGKEDQLIPVSESEAMHDAMNSSELHILPGAGHLSPYESPEIANSIITAFLERLP